MNNEDNQKEIKGDHYICLGGCRGVSQSPGVCQSRECVSSGHQLVKCNCNDGEHNNFEPMELKL